MKNNYKKFFPFLALLLGVAAMVMVFLPIIQFPDGDGTFTGVKVITGSTVLDLGAIVTGKMPFSFLALLAFSLPLAAGIVSVAMPRGFVAMILFIAATILIFLLPVYTVINVTGWLPDSVQEIEWILLPAGIAAGSLSVVGAIVSAAGFVSSK